MLSWIWNNRQWIFSGIGVVVLLGILEFARRQWKKRTGGRSGPTEAREKPAATSLTSECSESPTANEIEVSLGKLPPWQQLEARKSYVGVTVNWSLRFRNLVKASESGNIVLVMTRYGAEEWGARVTFEADVDRYPRLKIAKQGDRLRVKGVIADVDYSIRLRNISIEFE